MGWRVARMNDKENPLENVAGSQTEMTDYLVKGGSDGGGKNLRTC